RRTPRIAHTPPCLPLERSIRQTSLLPLPVSFPLFFYAADTPRSQHSFPTRRSSDLFRVVTVTGPPVMRTVSFSPPPYGRSSIAIDRKSTRLNSSHSQTSYAVFCLKKKNTSRELGQRRTHSGIRAPDSRRQRVHPSYV